MATKTVETPRESLLVILRYPDLVKAGIVSNRVTLKRWIERENFPAPLRLGPNSIGWRAEDIRSWIEERAAARNPQEVA